MAIMAYMKSPEHSASPISPTLTWQAPGLNHNIWLTHFYYKGEEAYPILEKWIAEEGENFWQTHVAERTHDIQMSRGTIHMYRMYGLMPIGDTPRRGAWWYHTDIDNQNVVVPTALGRTGHPSRPALFCRKSGKNALPR